ncbi:uncharacterized protein LOC106658601 [Trichogramma pretiosum]|uniref:uncharacterized protein LOC106658601 n=1 Tax=Trichogramma pretiosum TaxID=7493 RepID=UPI0006C95C2E|nr:uncharacterized protein LOC106658601 [Trichogramma pretiosum]XP_014236100.1 uncharacterized protein LOC106658601 [Trichogramma pretiosum]
MLKSTAKCLLNMKIILASGSPRRREIIQSLGFVVDVKPSSFDENLNRSDYNNYGDFVTDLAAHKVNDIFDKLSAEELKSSILCIGADTIVTKGEKLYGKPKNKEDAFDMLSDLSGSTHTVYTGVFIKTVEKEIKFWESTEVTFGNITTEQIHAYIETGEYTDKAGGYGIQGTGGCLVEKINGDYYTVVGLPLYSLIKHLNDFLSEA